MATQASAPAVSSNKTNKSNKKAALRPRGYVPPIEFAGNIEKAKDLLREKKYEEAGAVFIDNAFAPDFILSDITHNAHPDITAKVISAFSEFVFFGLKAENIDKRAIKFSALLRAVARFSGKEYFLEKQKLYAAIKALGVKAPKVVEDSCSQIEHDMKLYFSREDWIAYGFELKSENPGQFVVYHPELHQSITVYTPKPAPASEAEKAKARETRESKRRANQLERAAQFPGKVGGCGGSKKQEEGGKKKGKKK